MNYVILLGAVGAPADHQRELLFGHAGTIVQSHPDGVSTKSISTHGTSFETWKNEHGAEYNSPEAEKAAYETWKEADDLITTHNAGSSKFTTGHTHLSDWDHENHQKAHLGSQPVQAPTDSTTRRLSMHNPERQLETLPTAWDWSAQGKTPSILNQGDCGSCWAFASSHAISAAYAVENEVTATFEVSPQQIASCTNGASGLYSNGCQGGNSYAGMIYAGGLFPADTAVASNGAGPPSGWGNNEWKLSTGQTVGRSALCACNYYPFMDGGLKDTTVCGYTYGSGTSSSCKNKACTASTAETSQCDATKVEACQSGPSVSVKGFTFIDSEDGLMSAVYKTPVVVNIEAPRKLSFYKSGIFDACPTDPKQDHAVVLVGWGEDSTGNKYWKAMNSWGSSWGEDGYFRIERGEQACGIGYTAPGYIYNAYYPTGVSANAMSPPEPPSPPPPAPPPAGQEPYGDPSTSTCAPGTTNLNKVWSDGTYNYYPLSSHYGDNTIPCAPPCQSGACGPAASKGAAIPFCGAAGLFCVLNCYPGFADCPADMTCYGQKPGYYGTCVYTAA